MGPGKGTDLKSGGKGCGQTKRTKVQRRPSSSITHISSSSSAATSSSTVSYPSCSCVLGHPEEKSAKKSALSPAAHRKQMKAEFYHRRHYRHASHVAHPAANSRDDYCPSLSNYAFLALIYVVWTATVLLFQ